MPDELASPTMRLSRAQYEVVINHCFDGFPDEACGLLVGPLDAPGVVGGRVVPTGVIREVFPCRNADQSARTYTVDSRDMLRTMRDAEDHGDEIVGVWHSHTHTDAYPSVTDVRQAVDPSWLYAIVSLKYGDPVLRCYRIVDDTILEVAVEVSG